MVLMACVYLYSNIKSLVPDGIQTPDRPARSLVTTLIEMSHLPEYV